MLEKIYLIDECPTLIAAWKHAFQGDQIIDIIQDDYFVQPADAIVSPANSFGIMDGGLDRVIRYELGFAVEHRVQQQIQDQYHGELPVGSAVMVATDHQDWPWLIAAPTMRVPEQVSHTLNAYLAFRAVLLTVKHHNRSQTPIRSLVCAGLGTGIGRMSAHTCALQMKAAFDQLQQPARPFGAQEIWQKHRDLHIKP